MALHPPDARLEVDAPPVGLSRPHVLFVLYPAFGHTLPMVPIIAQLSRLDCRITATTGSNFADRVMAAGAEIATYTSHLATSAPPDSLTADEMAARTLRYLEEILAVSPVIERACPRPPDLIVYDTTLWAPSRVLAAHWRRPTIQVIPTFASNEHFSVGARLAELAPPVDPAHPDMIRTGSLLAEFVTGHGLPDARVGEVLAGADELNIVSIPREFQIFGDTFGDDHVFVGPCLEPPAGEWTPPGGDRPVALVSLGTTVNEHPGLFRACALAFTDTEWHVVMTLGDRIDPAELGPLPTNVEVHPWIPHAAVLRHASVFVCQGGMGSVQEALHYATPLVVIPHHPEQVANAERIDDLGLGRVLSRQTVSAELIRQAVAEAAHDRAVATRVTAMRDHIHAAGGAARAASEIHARAAIAHESLSANSG